MDIFDFQSDGTLAGSPYNFSDPIPAVLPGNTLTFHNDVNNDYFDGFTFGTYIHFGVRFYGPALTSPDGSPYGTSFLFTVYSDPDGANPALGTGVNQAAFSAEIFGDGTVSTVQSDFVTLSGAGTPEPGGMALMAARFWASG